METEHDQFQKLQKLLALKRYEQPPPRYFQDFSSKVLARIQAGEAVQQVTWRQRLGLDFDFRPAMMGAVGVVVCGLLLVGVISSASVKETTNAGFTMVHDPSRFLAAPTTDPAFVGGFNGTIAQVQESSIAPLGGESSGSPFGQLTPRAERVAFTFGGSDN
jgi:hypothetical protein